MNSSFSFEEEIDLSRFNTLYRTEPPTDSSPMSNLIPDGRYEVVVAEASLTKSQRSGNPMIRWVFRITGSTFRDRILRKHSAITENTLRFVRKELEICGLRLDRFEDLKARVQELEGVELEVVKVTKGEDSNIYFNRTITAQSQADGVAEDDLPF
ncbi:MAG: DUF669 domain-containing protein [Acidobacteria bacterium]|nr:DUF669 domain-containing protein [Acidobacteriota bacterium]